ncbi:hypothetical protein JD844_020862 [Phrynosoma platyrhinos]|uniref:D-glutamate cyclase-like C-terminal domain-containing protein n=1 Tax=Phrynosoma platyrhinos TaxID=52577 RepID=A0ABQ7SSP6_PHRPL|nr:hypothetical protein JD844_020862 [Phrynosoma platyrhinos]
MALAESKCNLENEEIIFIGHLKTLFPRAVRNLIRSDKLSMQNTSGIAEVTFRELLMVMFFRSDCLQYRKYENGECTEILTSLKEYSKQLKDMVTFYLGCSFTFEKALQEVGVPIRNVEQKCNVSMYKLVCDEKCLLGIKDLSCPDYGDAVQAHPGDVPVFWACGVTGVEAVRNCKSPLAFTHSPGCMFITDLKDDNGDAAPNQELPDVYCIGWNPLYYSIVSAAAVQKIRRLENTIGVDPGKRGVKHLCSQDELLKACLSMSHAQSVLITTGFPTHFKYDPPEENDGPPGAIAMASMLKALGKNVAIVTDQRALNLNKKIIQEAVEQGILETAVPVISYHSHSADLALQYNHLIAIERAGMAADGNYYNARKINIKHLVDPIDELFLAAKNIPGITTTGIGDGGNELGMGKVKEAVKKYIANGDVIACDVEADFTVGAVHDRYLRKAVKFPKLSKKMDWASALPSVAKEEKLLNILQQNEVRSGITASLEMEVDGLPFYNVHSLILEKLLKETLT